VPDRSGYDHRRLGAWGEDLVARRYLEAGYRVLDRNWRCPTGELDLVLGHGRTVVFCEVKTRSSERFGSPLEAVGPTKQRKLRAVALVWLAEHPALGPRREIRFDVAGVLGGRVEVVEGAF
jgi:putative endonuclease